VCRRGHGGIASGEFFPRKKALPVAQILTGAVASLELGHSSGSGSNAELGGKNSSGSQHCRVGNMCEFRKGLGELLNYASL
jgi:hypothetical protein